MLCYYESEGVIMKLEKTKLQIAREKAGLTQVEIADKAKVTVTCYQRYEYGDRKPRVDVAILIAQAVNSTVENLFGAATPDKKNEHV